MLRGQRSEARGGGRNLGESNMALSVPLLILHPLRSIKARATTRGVTAYIQAGFAHKGTAMVPGIRPAVLFSINAYLAFREASLQTGVVYFLKKTRPIAAKNKGLSFEQILLKKNWCVLCGASFSMSVGLTLTRLGRRP